MLKNAKIELELITDLEINLFSENDRRGGNQEIVRYGHIRTK